MVVFLLGLLKALLGKPDSLHSPGQIFPTALGVPPDLRGASSFWKLVENHGRVGMLAAFPTDPVGRVCLSYQARDGPSPKVDGGLFRNPLTSPNFTYANTCPERGILP